jgi:hypothetical protein
MCFGGPQFWRGRHASAGVPEPAYSWSFAEGATGAFFDTFILLSNPHDKEVKVNVYYTSDASVVVRREKTLAPRNRLTIILLGPRRRRVGRRREHGRHTPVGSLW